MIFNKSKASKKFVGYTFGYPMGSYVVLSSVDGAAPGPPPHHRTGFTRWGRGRRRVGEKNLDFSPAGKSGQSFFRKMQKIHLRTVSYYSTYCMQNTRLVVGWTPSSQKWVKKMFFHSTEVIESFAMGHLGQINT